MNDKNATKIHVWMELIWPTFLELLQITAGHQQRHQQSW